MDPEPNVLSPGYVLDGEYEIESILGQGGFAITYRASSRRLRIPVAIKEYFPSSLATRTTQTTIQPASQATVQDFNWAKDRFLHEMQMLAQFRHESIVRVSRCFEANNTAYAVLDYEDGQTLKQVIDSRTSPMRQEELDAFFEPLLDALEIVHLKGLLHRDIAPDNIIVRSNGRPVLIDFGAARETNVRHDKSTRALVKRGYSPIEQYNIDANAQGPPTDIYSLAATIYECIALQAPPEAIARTLRDELAPAAGFLGLGFRPTFLAAVDMALAQKPEDRPQSIAIWRREMFDLSDSWGGPNNDPITMPRPETMDAPDQPSEGYPQPPVQMPGRTVGRSPRTLPEPALSRRTSGARVLGAVASLVIVAAGVVLVTAATRETSIDFLSAPIKCWFDSSGCNAARDTNGEKGASSPKSASVTQMAPPAPVSSPGASSPSSFPTKVVPGPNMDANSLAIPDGVPSDARKLLTEYLTCVTTTPCNRAGCRHDLESRAEQGARAFASNWIEKTASAADRTCATMQEASSFAELSACTRSVACDFEVECLADYRAHVGDRKLVDRTNDIDALRKTARDLCTTKGR